MGKVALKHVLKNFLNHYETLESRRKLGNDDDLYHKEFQSLKELTETLKTNVNYSCSKGLEDVNVKKNRYKDILPYDYSRVILREYAGIPGSDYINANYIKGSTGSTCYIASQGPLPCTVVDFFRMIWECEITVIVMACNETESGRFKCEVYWPQSIDQTHTYGNITVSLVKWKQVSPDFLVRTLKIRSNDEERVVCQFHYHQWPDHSIPTSVEPILELVRLIRDVQASEARPILVHCSAGCGRTGTICSIDYVWALFRTGKLKEDFSLYQIISDMRRQRIAMVQTKEQYILCYRAVAALFEQQLKMIDEHTYVNLNEDGEPLVNSSDESDHLAEQCELIEHPEKDENGDIEDTLDKMSTSEDKENESPSVNSEEDGSAYRPDLIRTRRKNYFGELRESRLHKSTPDFELFNPISSSIASCETTMTKQNEKLVGKATVIRRSGRPSIAHLKAMFENINMPHTDNFVHNYNGRHQKKASMLKRSMSTREKVGHSYDNEWFAQHGSFENLNLFGNTIKKESRKDCFDYDVRDDEQFKSSDDEQSILEEKNNKNNQPFYNDQNTDDINKANIYHSHFKEPIYGFGGTNDSSVDQLDNGFMIESVLPKDQPPPKPPRTYQQSEDFDTGIETSIANNNSLNNQLNEIIDHMPSYLASRTSSSKNYYNTIGPIKHRSNQQEKRPPLMYCFNDTKYLKTYHQNSNQSKSTYNLHSNILSTQNSHAEMCDPSTMSRSVSINELSNMNNNYIYDAPNQRFGVLTTHTVNNNLIKPVPQQAPMLNQYQQEPQDFYGYIEMTNKNLTKPTATMLSPMNYQAYTSNQQPPDAYKISVQPTTLPKPNLHQFSSTLPSHYHQHNVNSTNQQQKPTFGMTHQQQRTKLQPPMSYVKPSIRNNNSTVNGQQHSYISSNQSLPLPPPPLPPPTTATTTTTPTMTNHHMMNLNGPNGFANRTNGVVGMTLNSASSVSLGNSVKNAYYTTQSINQHHQNHQHSSTLQHAHHQSNQMNQIQFDPQARSLQTNNKQTLNDNIITVNANQVLNSNMASDFYSRSKDMNVIKQQVPNESIYQFSECETNVAGKQLDTSQSATIKDQNSIHVNSESRNGVKQSSKSNKKSGAFHTLSSIFTFGKRKKDKKSNLNSSNPTNGHQVSSVPNNGNLIRPPHSHRRMNEFTPPAQWTQV